MVERFNKPTVKGVITSPQQTYLLNPGNNGIVINRLTTVAHIPPIIGAVPAPPVARSNSNRSVNVRTDRR
jgi:hypothetical protein